MKAAGINRTGTGGIKEMIGRLFPDKILFSIILPVYNTPAGVLEQTLLSIRNQTYIGWELCLVDDATEKKETLEMLSLLQKDAFFNKRLRFRRLKRNRGIVAASSCAVNMGKAPYLVFLDHDDMLHEDALLELAFVLLLEKNYSLLYTDSRTIDVIGKPVEISFKPDWSPESLVHLNYINHLTAVERGVFNNIGGFRAAFEGAQDLDLLLRLSEVTADDDVRHINKPLYDWRALTESTAYSGMSKPYSYQSAIDAVKDHLTMKGLRRVEVKANKEGRGFSCSWQVRERQLEIIIPVKDNPAGLKRCIEGLTHSTDYKQLLITIIAEHTVSSKMLGFLNSLNQRKGIRVIHNEGASQGTAFINSVLKEGTTPYVLFLNDNIEITDRKWLREMVKYLDLKGVGAVGAMLVGPDGSLCHNGIQTDEKAIAINIDHLGTKNELSITRNVSAVSGKILLMKRKTLELAGLLNEDLPYFFHDVDLCLSIRERGLRIVLATDVQLTYHRPLPDRHNDLSENQSEHNRSIELMRQKWGEKLRERYMAYYDVLSQLTHMIRVT